jgi:hypothetical protein
MDAIAKAISEIKFTIPREVLNAVFLQRMLDYRQTPSNIDNEILATVLRPRVLVDCDLIGGLEIYVPLNNVPMVQANLYTFVYRIPKSLTQNRSITQVLNVTYNDPTNLSTFGSTSTSQTSIAMQVAQGVQDAQGSIPMTSTADVQLIGDNVVMVKDMLVIPVYSYLRCRIGNDERMNHLQPGSYLAFAKACQMAVKSYIYNYLVIQMGAGQLQAGQLLAQFADVVNGYNDAEQTYEDYRKQVLQKVLFQNDKETAMRMLKLQFGGYR